MLSDPFGIAEIQPQQFAKGTTSITLIYTFGKNCEGLRGCEPIFSLQRFVDGGVFARAAWVDVATAVFHRPVGARRRSHGEMQIVIVENLDKESVHRFRLVHRQFDSDLSVYQEYFSQECVCWTTARPDASALPHCSNIGGDGCDFQWVLMDPDSAPIEECELQVCQNSALSSWRLVEGAWEAVEVAIGKSLKGIVDDGNHASLTRRRWHLCVRNLDGGTAYRLRARARNDVGWTAYSQEVAIQTLDRPRPPSDLASDGFGATWVAFTFVVYDIEGAAVTECRVELEGYLGWTSNVACTLDLGSEDEAGSLRRRCRCRLEYLSLHCDVCLRVWARNSAGWSICPSPVLMMHTALLPHPPAQIQLDVSSKTVECEWELEDPEGAPVLECEADFCIDSVLSMWGKIPARCVADEAGVNRVAKGNRHAGDRAEDESASLVAKRLPRRRWVANLDGLQADVQYLVRVRGRNDVGWSAFSQCFRVRLAPPNPPTIQSIEPLPDSVRLHVNISEDNASSVVSGLVVERCTLLSWLEARCVAERTPSGEEDAKARWIVIVPIEPKVSHTLRIFAINSFGRSKASAPCMCHTCEEPSKPCDIKCITRSPHTLGLQFFLPDPDGAPIWRCEVQVKEDSYFSSWQLACCLDGPCSHRLGNVVPGSQKNHWQARLERLKPDTRYFVCIRARNQVGWSPWETSEAAVLTSGCPSLAQQLVAYKLPGEEGIALEFRTEDPVGAPVVACAVYCSSSGRQVAAVRKQPLVSGASVVQRSVTGLPLLSLSPSGASQFGQWEARFAKGSELRSFFDQVTGISFGVRCANSVGWSRCAELQLKLLKDMVASAEQNVGVVDPLGSSDLLEGLKPSDTLAFLDHSLSIARERKIAAEAHGDTEHAEMLAAYVADVTHRSMLVEEILIAVAQAAKDTDAEEEGCKLVRYLQMLLEPSSLVSDLEAIAGTAGALLRCQIWLKSGWIKRLKLMTTETAQRVTSVMDDDRRDLFVAWENKCNDWAVDFGRRVDTTLPESVAMIAQLLASMEAGPCDTKVVQASRKSLDANYGLILAAERQLRCFRQSSRVLQATVALEGCTGFQAETAAGKVGTTILGALMMLTMPVPGTVEVGAYSLGMLWLEDDPSRRHVILKHETATQAVVLLESLAGVVPSSTRRVVRAWDEAAVVATELPQPGSVSASPAIDAILVLNISLRRLTVTLLPEDDSLSDRAYNALARANPLFRLATKGLRAEPSGITIMPMEAGVVLVPQSIAGTIATFGLLDAQELSMGQKGPIEELAGPRCDGMLPVLQARTRRTENEAPCLGLERDVSGSTAVAVKVLPQLAPEAAVRPSVRLEFAYGPNEHKDKVVGRTRVHHGAAISFVCLDNSVRIHTKQAEEDDVVAEQKREIEVVNNDLASATIRLSLPKESRPLLSNALAEITLKAGESGFVAIPSPVGDGKFGLASGETVALSLKDSPRKIEACQPTDDQATVSGGRPCSPRVEKMNAFHDAGMPVLLAAMQLASGASAGAPNRVHTGVDYDGVFDVEIVREGAGKIHCEVRLGSCLTIEGM